MPTEDDVKISGLMRRFAGRVVFGAVVVALMALVAGLAVETRAAENRSVQQVEGRFADRIGLAASYVEAHIDDMRTRQLHYAELQLDGLDVTPTEFDQAALSFGFAAAVLLDDRGRVVAVSPQRADLIGTELASDYHYLSEAVEGRGAVSDVFLWGEEELPIIAVALPFDTPTGRRVISGGYRLGESSMVVFLQASSSLAGRELYLVDGVGQIIATTEAGRSGSLADDAPALASAAVGSRTVSYHDQQQLVVVTPIGGTDWRLVASVPVGQLLGPIRGVVDKSWNLVAASVVLSIIVLALLTWVFRQRDHLHRLSRTDPLTELANRRHADGIMARSAAVSLRSDRPWAVAIIDIDRFKSVNDLLGHAKGDRVIRHVASVLQREMRCSDFCARWGGEEFVVVMEATDLDESVTTAERIVQAVRNSPTDDGIEVTVSIGVAAAVGGDADDLLSRADRALYEAKEAGRDRVMAAVESVPTAQRRSERLRASIV